MRQMRTKKYIYILLFPNKYSNHSLILFLQLE